MDIVEWLRWNAKEQGSRFGEAADEIERLREENQRQKEKIMLLNSMVQTEHEIICVATQKEGK